MAEYQNAKFINILGYASEKKVHLYFTVALVIECFF